MTQTQIQDFLMFTDNMILAGEPLDYEICVGSVSVRGKIEIDSYKIDGFNLELYPLCHDSIAKMDLKECQIRVEENKIVYVFENKLGNYFKIIFYENL